MYRTQDGPVFPLAIDIQRAFEETQKAAEASGEKQYFTVKMVCYPRKTQRDNYSECEYELQQSKPKEKSGRFTTELSKDGFITASGKDPIDITQLNLEFHEPVKLRHMNGDE